MQLTPALLDTFWETYNAGRIVQWVGKAINEIPRKLKYQVVVDWYLSVAPEGVDTMTFLGDVFDEETGLVKGAYIGWMLQRFGVLDGPEMDLSHLSTTEAAEAAAAGGEGKGEGKGDDSSDGLSTSSPPPPPLLLSVLPRMVRQLSLGEAWDEVEQSSGDGGDGGDEAQHSSLRVPSLPQLARHLSLEEVAMAKENRRREKAAFRAGLEARWVKSLKNWRSSFGLLPTTSVWGGAKKTGKTGKAGRDGGGEEKETEKAKEVAAEGKKDDEEGKKGKKDNEDNKDEEEDLEEDEEEEMYVDDLLTEDAEDNILAFLEAEAAAGKDARPTTPENRFPENVKEKVVSLAGEGDTTAAPAPVAASAAAAKGVSGGGGGGVFGPRAVILFSSMGGSSSVEKQTRQLESLFQAKKVTSLTNN